MAIQTYIVPTDRMVHETKVDFNQRCVQQKTIHIVQYDKSLPVIAVELFLNGSTYTLPANADVKIRWSKRDKTFVYKNVLGCDEFTSIGLEITVHVLLMLSIPIGKQRLFQIGQQSLVCRG